MLLPNKAPYQFLEKVNEVELFVKREDLIHPEISGNKWRKLFYNIEQAKKRGNDTILTFGGAYSNHLHALAYTCYINGFKSIGVIRGEQLAELNPTLKDAAKWGMKFHYVDRETYRLKHTFDVKEELRELFDSFYLVPEGGSNFYGTNGCMEILDDESSQFDIIAVPAGTGCTAAGIAMSLKEHQKLLVFPALKNGAFLLDEMKNYMLEVMGDEELVSDKLQQVVFINDYHFGGYAKINETLISFLNNHHNKLKVKWDAVYNGKMVYGIYDKLEQGYFNEGTKVLLIHTGGLQGNRGIEERLGMKMYP